ncbi:MAG TPA: hypothetical protein EYQ82_07450 [Dehalococcoidia bacterium]|nr:hypothetical protein [Dehalococcoidia bacterium]
MSARIALDAMRQALYEGKNERINPNDIKPAPLVTWPSTLTEVDERCGGFYGLVTIGAQRGTGKTLLAIGSSLEATARFQVCHFAAEDDADGLACRFNNYVNSHTDILPHLDDWHLFQTTRGQTPESLLVEIERAVDPDSPKPILTVIDSVNSLVEMSNYSYFDGLTAFGLWAMLARRISRGQAAFLYVSETNKSNSIKAEKLPYWSDQVLVITRGDGADIVEIELQKSRRTQGVGHLGKFIRLWSQGEFMSEEELEGLRRESFRVVEGGKHDRLTPIDVAVNEELF